MTFVILAVCVGLGFFVKAMVDGKVPGSMAPPKAKTQLEERRAARRLAALSARAREQERTAQELSAPMPDSASPDDRPQS